MSLFWICHLEKTDNKNFNWKSADNPFCFPHRKATMTPLPQKGQIKEGNKFGQALYNL